MREHPRVPSNPRPSDRVWRVALKPCRETVTRAPAICPAQHDKCEARRRDRYRPHLVEVRPDGSNDRPSGKGNQGDGGNSPSFEIPAVECHGQFIPPEAQLLGPP